MKKGYISIELVIVAGIVLVFGLFAVTRFINQGKAASEKQNDAMNAAFEGLEEYKGTEWQETVRVGL
mgnify:CR=1 FL=1